MARKFVILALPRSRTKWLSEFLSYEGSRCGHDLIVQSDTVRDFQKALAAHVGTVETGGMVGWKLLRQEMPETKLFVIRRDVGEVYQSFRRLGLLVDPSVLEERAEMLDACSASGVRTLRFEDLASFWACKEIFEECLDIALDEGWWEGLRHTNIQIDMPKRIAELQQRGPALEGFTREVLLRTSKMGDMRCLGLN